MYTMCKLQVLWATWWGAGNWTPRFSGRTIWALNHWAIAIVPHPLLLRKDLIAKAALEHLIFLPLLPKCWNCKCTRQINLFWSMIFSRFTEQCSQPRSCFRALPSSQEDSFCAYLPCVPFSPSSGFNMGFRILVPFLWSRRESLTLESLLGVQWTEFLLFWVFLSQYWELSPARACLLPGSLLHQSCVPRLVFWFKMQF